MTPEQNWDGPVQDAIREHDRALGHFQGVERQQEVEWFKRFPTGGTSYGRVTPVEYFRRAPNGGGTVYVQPSGSGNPYARIDEDPSLPRPVVDVELPALENVQGRSAPGLLTQGSDGPVRAEPAVAAATDKGHVVEWDPDAQRGTCTRCGNAVLDYQGHVYGGALQITCDESIARWEAMGR
jgi:hypothetical protein